MKTEHNEMFSLSFLSFFYLKKYLNVHSDTTDSLNQTLLNYRLSTAESNQSPYIYIYMTEIHM